MPLRSLLSAKLAALCAGAILLLHFSIRLHASRSSPPASAFYTSVHRQPVGETDETLNLENNPLSSLRPRNQFLTSPSRLNDEVLALATLLYLSEDATAAQIQSSYDSLAQSSLQPWVWYIYVQDSLLTKQSETISKIQELAQRDERIEISQAHWKSEAAALNSLTETLKASKALTATFLIPGTMYEPTWLEKAAWSLLLVPDWKLVSPFSIFSDGSAGRLYKGGLAFPDIAMTSYELSSSPVFRTDAIDGCSFSTLAHSLQERLWLFWMCFAAHGHWGGTIAEVGTWLPHALEAGPTTTAQEHLEAAYPRLTVDSFPKIDVAKAASFEDVSWQAPFENQMIIRDDKSILIVQGWLLVGGSELGFLEVLRFFAERGYRVTMILTRFLYPEGHALRPLVAQYTNDIHFLPAFLRMDDFASYIKYIIESRQITTALLTNSQLIYEILPALAEQAPQVKWIDYLHNEGYDGWKGFGFPSFSIITQRYLSRTLTCSDYLKTWLVEHGFPESRVGTAKLGIDTTHFAETSVEQRRDYKSSVLGLDPETFVIAWSARLDTQKRPLLVPSIMKRVLEKAGDQCPEKQIKMYMMGGGALKDALRSGLRANNLTDTVTMLGTVDNTSPVLRSSDIFLLPTAMEGLSIAVAEAMAMGLPIVSSKIGGVPEQLGAIDQIGSVATGHLVDVSQSETGQIEDYATAVVDLACDEGLRLKKGHAAAAYIRKTFDQRETLKQFITEIEAVEKPQVTAVSTTPNPAIYYGLSSLAREDYQFVDLHATQLKLKRAIRPSPGKLGVLENKCFIEDASKQAWAQAVTEPVICESASAYNVSANALFHSAKEQCGSWCVWDLRTPRVAGWRYNGRCFTPLEADSNAQRACADWFYQRPDITLFDMEQ